MKFNTSEADVAFKDRVESCSFPVADFDHRAHVRLAYVYLCGNDTERSTDRMRDTLTRFLIHNGVDPSKYHETLTSAWILAVRHFMNKTGGSESADEFIESNRDLLDTKIMMTHYSAELLFSDEARAEFVQPDLDPIPRYDE